MKIYKTLRDIIELFEILIFLAFSVLIWPLILCSIFFSKIIYFIKHGKWPTLDELPGVIMDPPPGVKIPDNIDVFTGEPIRPARDTIHPANRKEDQHLSLIDRMCERMGLRDDYEK